MNTSLQALYTESDYAVVSETEGNDCIVSVCNELSDQQKEAISFSGLFQTAAIGFSIRVSPNQAAYYVKATAAELEALGVSLRLGEGYLEELTEDVIFRTPGMRPDLPQLSAAVTRGAVLTSEMEAFFEVCPCSMLAVTGSDGKTTTTTIIASLLREAGRTVHLGGNIGHPLLAVRMRTQSGALSYRARLSRRKRRAVKSRSIVQTMPCRRAERSRSRNHVGLDQIV